MNYIKILFLFLFVNVLLGCGDDDEIIQECLPDNLQNGIIAAYTFNDGSLEDASGNGNDLTNVSATSTSGRNNTANCAYEFEEEVINTGTPPLEIYLESTNTSFLDNLNTFTISLWYYSSDPDRPVGAYETLIRRGENPDTDWSIGLFDVSKPVFIHSTGVAAWASQLFDYNEWHHLVAMRNGDILQIYVDNELYEVDQGNNAPLDEGDLIIGKGFAGKIDDILIYDRALSVLEIGQLYANEPCCN